MLPRLVPRSAKFEKALSVFTDLSVSVMHGNSCYPTNCHSNLRYKFGYSDISQCYIHSVYNSDAIDNKTDDHRFAFHCPSFYSAFYNLVSSNKDE